jgi:hypothetical protein
VGNEVEMESRGPHDVDTRAIVYMKGLGQVEVEIERRQWLVKRQKRRHG